MMIETFSMVGAAAVLAAGCSSATVMAPPFSDAAAWLGDAADLRRELRGALREELVELLDRHPGGLPEGADRGRRALLGEAAAHELHDLPVAIGEHGDAVGRGDLLRDRTVP